ncbi:MAG: nucleoside recognition domain-containing protein [Rhodoferax sp.]|nr:nucleoside recognition domain-containing protein [Rhodoferax sp.]
MLAILENSLNQQLNHWDMIGKPALHLMHHLLAAREVFVGTVSTIYSIGSGSDDEKTVKQRLKAEINPETGQPRYTTAVAFSLLVFYVFAMMCMSTLAVTYRETKRMEMAVYTVNVYVYPCLFGCFCDVSSYDSLTHKRRLSKNLILK